MSQADVMRSVKIKTNTLKRLHKELSYYQQEREAEQARVEEMKSSGADAHDLRQAVSMGAGRSVCMGHELRCWAARLE